MPLVEQLCDGNLLIGALDRLGEHGRDGQVLDAGLGQLRFADGSGNGIEQGQLLDAARLKALKRGTGENAVARAGVDLLRAADFNDRLGGCLLYTSDAADEL